MSENERLLFVRYARAKVHKCVPFCDWYVYESGHLVDDMMRDVSQFAPGYDQEIAESLAMDGLP